MIDDLNIEFDILIGESKLTLQEQLDFLNLSITHYRFTNSGISINTIHQSSREKKIAELQQQIREQKLKELFD